MQTVFKISCKVARKCSVKRTGRHFQHPNGFFLVYLPDQASEGVHLSGWSHCCPWSSQFLEGDWVHTSPWSLACSYCSFLPHLLLFAFLNRAPPWKPSSLPPQSLCRPSQLLWHSPVVSFYKCIHGSNHLVPICGLLKNIPCLLSQILNSLRSRVMSLISELLAVLPQHRQWVLGDQSPVLPSIMASFNSAQRRNRHVENKATIRFPSPDSVWGSHWDFWDNLIAS